MCSVGQGYNVIYMLLLAIFLSMTLVSGVVQLFRTLKAAKEKEADKKEITTAVVEIVVGILALVAFGWLGLCITVMLKALPLAVLLYILWNVGAKIVANRKKEESSEGSESGDATESGADDSDDAKESGADDSDDAKESDADKSDDAAESNADEPDADKSDDTNESSADDANDSLESNSDDATKSDQVLKKETTLDNTRVKRIIPCLDVNEGRVVKGVNFVDIKDAGDPVEIARAYSDAGADELVFLDITATTEARQTRFEMVKKVAESITIPFTVGGGIRSKEDFAQVLAAGADKGSVNSAAIERPELVKELVEEFGSERVVVAIDVKKRKDGSGWNVYKNGGQVDSGLDALTWAKQVEELGAGELLVTSMDCDGTRSGYDLEVTRSIAEAVNIPVIASGGAGKLDDFYDIFTYGKADAALAASLFHFKELEIQEVKEYLKKEVIPVKG